MKNLLIAITTITATTLSYAQPTTGFSSGISESGVNDGFYVRETVPTKGVKKQTHVREADVTWQKRVWRTIDLREKMNHPLYYPIEPQNDRRALWDVIKYGALEEGSITLYEATDPFGNPNDQFSFPVLPANGNFTDSTFRMKLKSYFYDLEEEALLSEDGEEVYDEITGELITTTFEIERGAEEIIAYKLKEDWFLDKQRGVVERRIIGLAPVVYSKDQNGDIRGTKTLFWLYFPECRYVFQNFSAYNRKNDAQRMSFDDLFWKHMYSSYITKESNVENSRINQKYDGVDALLESERIKRDMNKIEHDIWHL